MCRSCPANIVLYCRRLNVVWYTYFEIAGNKVVTIVYCGFKTDDEIVILQKFEIGNERLESVTVICKIALINILLSEEMVDEKMVK